MARNDNDDNTPTFTLVDDGTLDTVLQCDRCKAWERYGQSDEPYDVSDDEYRARVNGYGVFVAWAVRDASDTHVCIGDD